MNLQRAIVEFLRKEYADATPRRLERSKEGICVLPMPTVPAEDYMDGSKTVTLYVQIMVRRYDGAKAQEVCADVCEWLEGQRFEISEGLMIDGLEVYAYPQELEFDAQTYTTWECRLCAEVLRGRRSR